MATSTIKQSSDSIIDITSQVTFRESIAGTNTCVYVKNGQLYVYYQGESKQHSSGNSLFTLPSGYTLKHLTYHPFVVNGAAFGNVSLTVIGVCSINQISSTSENGRIYMSFSVPLA